jgi:hypothetical protein
MRVKPTRGEQDPRYRHAVFRPACPLEDSCVAAAHQLNERYRAVTTFPATSDKAQNDKKLKKKALEP